MFRNTFKMLLLGSIFALAPISGPAQGLPCTGPNDGQIDILRLKRNFSDRWCPSRRKPGRMRKDLGGNITISGTITHQNGLRMGGITMTVTDLGDNTTRVVVSDETGFYSIGNLFFGGRYQLVPSRATYEFYPPAVI